MDNSKTILTAGLSAIAVSIALSGCSGSATKEATSATSSSATATSTAAPAAAHNQADVMFAQNMIPHHQQAIEMSDMILGKQGVDPRVVDLATQIKAAQGPEIAQMQGWLTQWGTPMMPGMPGSGDMPMHDMPGMGMMSTADMDALKNADGPQANKLFLTQMIQHHQGAIAMAHNEIKDGRFADAIALSKSIIASQQKEIDTMSQMLSTM